MINQEVKDFLKVALYGAMCSYGLISIAQSPYEALHLVVGWLMFAIGIDLYINYIIDKREK